MNIEQANKEATTRMIEARPVLVGLAKAKDVIPGMKDNLLLHAGPPIEWARMSGPLRGAIIGALIFEGKAKNEAEARALVERGEVQFDSCHHHGAVGPMAGVTSPNMSVYVLENKTHGNKSFSNLNEGYGKVLRYGAFSDDVLKRLRWMEDVLAPMLRDAIEASGGVDIKALLAEAMHMGDEGHNRNKAGSILFLRNLAPHLARAARTIGLLNEIARKSSARRARLERPVRRIQSDSMVPTTDMSEHLSDVLKYVGENALSVLNPVMAACKAMADAAHGIEGSTIVTAMARNGTELGIRVSGLGARWFTAEAGIPAGLYFPGFKAEDANRDIGDSTITETAGIGGFAMAAAPAIVTFVSGTSKDAITATMEMYEITFAEHKYFTIPYLEFRGTPTGIDIRKVVEKNITPRINTGIAHKDAGVGQIGAGLVRAPMKVFEDALVAYAEKYQ